jgi:hypothetical protein
MRCWMTGSLGAFLVIGMFLSDYSYYTGLLALAILLVVYAVGEIVYARHVQHPYSKTRERINVVGTRATKIFLAISLAAFAALVVVTICNGQIAELFRY